jgi:phosphoribosylformylglycinamidine cyclo-ligase
LIRSAAQAVADARQAASDRPARSEGCATPRPTSAGSSGHPPLPDGRAYGEALCDPSVIYVRLIAALQSAAAPVHYAARVTGYGWRKLMRLDTPFVYRTHEPGKPLPIVDFLLQSGVTPREAYATFNMSVGFELYVSQTDCARVRQLAEQAGHHAWIAGEVVPEGDREAIEVPSLGLCYETDSLRLR